MALAVILALSLTVACRSSSSETVLRFWAMGREGEVVVDLVREFERAHPGIRVNVQQLPWTAAHEKLLTAFAGGTMNVASSSLAQSPGVGRRQCAMNSRRSSGLA